MELVDAAQGGDAGGAAVLSRLALGVPTAPPPPLGQPKWWQRWWYPRPPVGERVDGAVFRERVLRLTAPLVVEVCSRLQDAVWGLQDAFVPSAERRRLGPGVAGSVPRPQA